MTLVLQLTRDKQDAEDLYQEVFMKAYKAIGSFRLESEFFTWLYRITVNSFYNLQRKASRIQQKTAFVMKHYEGLKIREIATIMNLSDGTVKRYLFRAIEKLRPMLQEYRYA